MHDPIVSGLLVGGLFVAGLMITGLLATQYPTVGDPPNGPDDRTFVVDRITNDDAVLLVESDDDTLDSRRVPIDSLPPAAREEGILLHETNHGYAVHSGTTINRAKTASRRFDQLSTPLADAAHETVG